MSLNSRTAATGRPLRADAARNRAAIVAAAAELMAQHGTDVSLEAVARAAGTGSATLHRHFAGARSLVEAVLEDRMRAYAEAAEALAEQSREQPWEAFAAFVDLLVKHLLEDHAFGQIIGSPCPVSDAFSADQTRSFVASLRLVRRAKRAKAVRHDFEHSDLYLLAQAVNGFVAADRSTAGVASHRLAAYLLQAFRVTEAGELPSSPESWRPASGPEFY